MNFALTFHSFVAGMLVLVLFISPDGPNREINGWLLYWATKQASTTKKIRTLAKGKNISFIYYWRKL